MFAASAFSETSANANSFTLVWNSSCNDIDIRQTSISQQFTGLCRGSAFDDYACQTVAAVEHKGPDARHAVRYRHVSKSAAIRERPIPDARHAVRYRHRRQSAAALERIISNARHAVRYRHLRQSAAVGERRYLDARHTVRYRHARQSTAIVERSGPNARHGGTYFYFSRILDPSWFHYCSASFRHQSSSHQCRTIHDTFYQVVAFRSIVELDMGFLFHNRFGMRLNPVDYVLRWIA